MFATDSKSQLKKILKVLYLMTLLNLSGPGGIRTHIKAIKIIMEKFQRQSQRSSRYNVRTIHKHKTEMKIITVTDHSQRLLSQCFQTSTYHNAMTNSHLPDPLKYHCK